MITLQLLRGLGAHGNATHELLVRGNRPWCRRSRRICVYVRLPNLDLLGSASLLGLGCWFGFAFWGDPLRLGAGVAGSGGAGGGASAGVSVGVSVGVSGAGTRASGASVASVASALASVLASSVFLAGPSTI